MITDHAEAPARTAAPRCTTCKRRSPTPICAECQNRANQQLEAVPDLLDRLAYATVKAGASLGEFVSGGAFGSRPPVSVDALTLLAHTPQAIGLAITDPQPPTGQAGDSIPLWAISWAAVWRQRFGHHQPAGVRATPTSPEPDLVPLNLGTLVAAAQAGASWSGTITHAREERAAELAAHEDAHARAALYWNRVVLGLAVVRIQDPTADGGWRPMTWADDGADLLAEHWWLRFGRPARIRRVMVDLAYLTTWLDKALEEFDDADQFIVSLRSLTAAARSVVGERSDLVRLGRCPETVRNRDTGEQEPCGGLLAQDPSVTHIVCPRCRAETNELGRFMLARRIRDVWGTSAGRDSWTT